MNTDQKIDKILESITDMKVNVARSLVHQENHANAIKQLEDYKEKDKAFKNKAIGALAVLNVFLADCTSVTPLSFSLY